MSHAAHGSSGRKPLVWFFIVVGVLFGASIIFTTCSRPSVKPGELTEDGAAAEAGETPPAGTSVPGPVVVHAAVEQFRPAEQLDDVVMKSRPRSDPNRPIVARLMKPGDKAVLEFGAGDDKTGWVYVSRLLTYDVYGQPNVKGLVTKDTSYGTGAVAGEFWVYTRVPGVPKMEQLTIVITGFAKREE